jgi:hypothetical protein
MTIIAVSPLSNGGASIPHHFTQVLDLVKNLGGCLSEILRAGDAVSVARRGQPKYDYRNSGTPDS